MWKSRTLRGGKMKRPCKFEVGQQLSTRSVCNHDCIYKAVVIGRTEKTVTIETCCLLKFPRFQKSDNVWRNRLQYDKKTRRCKIHLSGEKNEYIYPFGRYSMCPIFRANMMEG
jgi:hypothetical protein